MEMTKEQKIEILNQALILVYNNYLICNAVQVSYQQTFRQFEWVDDILPEFLAMKPFLKNRYDSWFGSPSVSKNITTRISKVNKLISLYQRDIWIEMFAWRVVGKIKSIFKN